MTFVLSRRGPFTASGTLARLGGPIASAILSTCPFDEPSPFSGVGGPVATASYRYGVQEVNDGSGNLISWSGASAPSSGARPTIQTTAGSAGYIFDGSDDQLDLPAAILFTASTGYTIFADWAGMTNANSNMFGNVTTAPDHTFERRIMGDPNAFRFYGSLGLRAPSITAVSATDRRICVFRGDSTVWRGWQNGGTGSGASASAGDFQLENIGRVAASFSNVRLITILIYPSALSNGDISTIGASLAAQTDNGSVTWTDAT